MKSFTEVMNEQRMQSTSLLIMEVLVLIILKNLIYLIFTIIQNEGCDSEDLLSEISLIGCKTANARSSQLVLIDLTQKLLSCLSPIIDR